MKQKTVTLFDAGGSLFVSGLSGDKLLTPESGIFCTKTPDCT